MNPNQSSHPIAKVEPGHHMKKAHFVCLFPGSCSFSHNPNLMNFVQDWNLHRPVNQKLYLSTQKILNQTHPLMQAVQHNSGGVRVWA